jgi:hypothetical protein
VEGTTTQVTFHGEDPVIQIKKVKFNIHSGDGNRSIPVKKAFFVPKLNVSAILAMFNVSKSNDQSLNVNGTI